MRLDIRNDVLEQGILEEAAASFALGGFLARLACGRHFPDHGATTTPTSKFGAVVGSDGTSRISSLTLRAADHCAKQFHDFGAVVRLDAWNWLVRGVFAAGSALTEERLDMFRTTSRPGDRASQ